MIFIGKRDTRNTLFLIEKIMKIFYQNRGYCPICSTDVEFIAYDDWFRDHYICSNCHSIPRERALMFCIDKFFPNWVKSVVHESSPVFRGVSSRLSKEALNYIPTYYYPNISLGKEFNGFRCENLECLTFKDESIDLHITQDVFEHILNPERAFREIARTLKPGGMHIFTVPLVNKFLPSKVCAYQNKNDEIIYLTEPEFHGDPTNENGSLVVTRWGYDICEFIHRSSGLFSHMVYIDSLENGIRAEYIEVLISIKPNKI
jgi:hypothetical protein